MTKRHLFHAFSTFKPGGAETRTVGLMNAWGSKYKHSIFAMDGNYDATSLIEPTVDFSVVKIDVLKGRWLPNLFEFRSKLKDVKPDVLLTYNFGAFEWAFSNWPHVCYHIHVEDGFLFDEIVKRNRRRSAIRAVAMNLLPIQMVTISENLTRIAKKEWKSPDKQLNFLPNGIKLDKFVHQSKADPKTFVCGTVAGLRPEKRVDRIIEAFSSSRNLNRGSTDWLLKIAGAGPEFENLKNLVAQLGLQDVVSFVGHLTDPAEFYSTLDAFVLGSDTEQMPLVVLEAMAAALPVASTDVGDVSKMLGGVNSSLVGGLSAIALSEQILKLASSVELRLKCGRENFEKVRRHYSFIQMADRWQEIIEKKKPRDLVN